MKKKTKHTHKQQILHRLKIAAGHLHKVIRMVEEDEYCIDVIHQSLAVQSALKQVDSEILADHLSSCVPQALPAIDKTKQQELLDLYKASRR